jgi:hypothetical protein
MLDLPRSRRFGALLFALVVPACTNAGPGADEGRDAGRPRGDANLPEPPRSDAQVEDLVVPSDVLDAQSPSSEASIGLDATTHDGPSAACDPTSLVCDSLRPLPSSIKETGFFPAAPDFTTVAPALTEFQPSLELWSNGLGKKRFVLLPAGGKIDIQDRERWVPPVGTVFIKLFLADGPNGPNTRPIETRIIRRTSDPDPLNEYEFAVYQWNEAGTDATLLDKFWPAADVTLAVGGQAFTHVIPSRSDCDKCHGTNDTVVIGFDELRLDWKLPGAATTQLETFAARGAFKSPLPANPERISVPTNPLLEKVEGFVHGNCAHCHNGTNSTVFDLRYPTFVQNTVGQMTMGSGTTAGLRVDPGKPDNSILYRQVTRMMLPPGLNPMPPVGVQRAPDEGLALLRKWILALPHP